MSEQITTAAEALVREHYRVEVALNDPRQGTYRSHVGILLEALDAARSSQPAPSVSAEQDGMDRACAWSDYRSEYGVGADLVQAHKHFCAGWDAARGRLDIGEVTP